MGAGDLPRYDRGVIDKLDVERRLRLTLAITETLRALVPDVLLNARFERILAVLSRNGGQVRDEFDEPPSTLPSGWAALLYLYNAR